MTNERTPEDVIVSALGVTYGSRPSRARTADRILRELKLAGFELIDTLSDLDRKISRMERDLDR